MRFSAIPAAGVLFGIAAFAAAADPGPFEEHVRPILLQKCQTCHGAERSRRKAELDLRTAESTLRGGESGPVVVPHKPDESLLWQLIDSGSMPPEGSPSLSAAERQVIHDWIAAGAAFPEEQIPQDSFTSEERNFWAFVTLHPPQAAASLKPDQNGIDLLIQHRLHALGLDLAPQADPHTLCRRLYLDLIGLPPTPEQLHQYVNDSSPDAYPNLVELLLQSPHYGERWGRQWLDVVGYADSNGYLRHDSPRPLAWRYRDAVIDSLNLDLPYDQFWREQLAGDELVEYPAPHLSQEDLRRLTATHFLRNAPDGTDNSEGNEATRVMERYAVLEAQLQIMMSAMFGITIDCARCHSHKFDPIPHEDYYALQAVLAPAFDVRNWVVPNDRWIYAAGEDRISAWKASVRDCDQEVAHLQAEFRSWILEHSEPVIPIWTDDFSVSTLLTHWDHTAPGDDHPAGTPCITLDSQQAPSAFIESGELTVNPGPLSGAWLVSRQKFDWTPEEVGDAVQLTFDVVRSGTPSGPPAERIGYYIALHDFDDSSELAGGNVLIDGNPHGPSSVFIDYPGADVRPLGSLGATPYAAGHKYGVKITRVEDHQLLLQHLINETPDGDPLICREEDLPDGGIGFECCCSRNFTVDNVVVAESKSSAPQRQLLQERRKQLEQALVSAKNRQLPEPEKLAWVSDLAPVVPEVPLLKRGDYFSPGPAVPPGVLSILEDQEHPYSPNSTTHPQRTTGTRLAFANWATAPDSRAAALLARVHVDRLWRGHFGTGLVPTPENFGASGVAPEMPELLEWLAAEFVRSGWRQKAIHRQIVLSRTYRQSSVASDPALRADPGNRSYSRFPAHRLDAEQIRDSMLTAAGLINLQMGGEPVDFIDRGNRQVVLPVQPGDGPHPTDRRGIYLRQRRSQPITFLKVFDEGTPEPNCLARNSSVVVGQSLAMLNGPEAVRASRQMAQRIQREVGDKLDRQVQQGFLLTLCRMPDDSEQHACQSFLRVQAQVLTENGHEHPASQALAELCKVLMASNEFLQLQ